jgi:hypothetical protein
MAPELVWTHRIEEKSFRLCRGSNLDRLLVQPVVRHYTDWATRLLLGHVTSVKTVQTTYGTSEFYICVCYRCRSRVSSDNIASDYGRSIPGRRQKDFSSILCVQTGSGAHPATCTMGIGDTFPGGKALPGRDADHSPPSSAEVENK